MLWALLLIVLAVTFITTLMLWHRGRRERVLRRRMAIEHIRLLRRLIEHLQQHRGLTYGIGSGERGLESRRWAVRQQLHSLFDEASGLAWCLVSPDDWLILLGDWEVLRETCDEGQPDAVMQQHCQLVARLIRHVAEMARRYDLVDQGRLLAPPSGLWLNMLENTELMGQARALGTAFAARRVKETVIRERLQQLYQSISQQAYLPLAAVDSDPQLAGLLSGKVQIAEEALDRYLESIERLLSGQMQRDEGGTAYYLGATEAIGAHMLLVDLLLEHLRQQP